MTDQEYEQEYRYALHELRSQGYDTGEPKTTKGGRLVLVDGFPCSDWEIFRRAYGEQTAEMITGERAGPQSRPPQAKASS